jgi:hypothetical protein
MVMSPITMTVQDVQGAEGLQEIPAAAHQALETALEETRARETSASPGFAARMIAAASAATGGDAILCAPAPPRRWRGQPQRPCPEGLTEISDAAARRGVVTEVRAARRAGASLEDSSRTRREIASRNGRDRSSPAASDGGNRAMAGVGTGQAAAGSHMLSATLIVTPGGDDLVDAAENIA